MSVVMDCRRERCCQSGEVLKWSLWGSCRVDADVASGSTVAVGVDGHWAEVESSPCVVGDHGGAVLGGDSVVGDGTRGHGADGCGGAVNG